LFTGGVQRVAQLTARSYQAELQRTKEAKQLALKRDEDEKLRLQQEIEKGFSPKYFCCSLHTVCLIMFASFLTVA